MANIEIKLVKSLNGRLAKHKATAEALGLRHIGDGAQHESAYSLSRRWFHSGGQAQGPRPRFR